MVNTLTYGCNGAVTGWNGTLTVNNSATTSWDLSYVKSYLHTWKTSNAIIKGDYCEWSNFSWGDTATSFVDYKWTKWKSYDYQPQSLSQQLKDIIKNKMSPGILIRSPEHNLADIREGRAYETLRSMLGEADFRNYIRRGHLTFYSSKTGYTYQIFKGSKMTKVFEKGQHIKNLCVVLSGDYTPTDVLITRFLMLINCESEFWRIANQFTPQRVLTTKSTLQLQQHNLIEVFKQMKAA